ncbi:MAG: hypothetical protein IPI59_15750 [Sphingobacteriales bacterium]|nr:hypothetical protein [Sphingobacteriales bacterium]MBP9141938.1 hypothetical protein [Chitinophagales bacterium]MDA0199761.1 hypothetical protein [Bacteroidota bacterium]MBK6888543.1 hypothetical protein [Sphingobacteriales bacterium]MBK7528949.1 hypothetical protein [Sphingobacteriales bacterium]
MSKTKQQTDSKNYPPAITTNTNWLCIPGQKVGAITATTTEADLKKIFGPNHIQRDSVRGNQGVFIPATRIFANTSDELRLIWEPSNPYKSVLRIVIEHQGARWHTADSIKTGCPISVLAKSNGNPFYFNSLGMPYPGNIISWDGGLLDNLGLGGQVAFKGNFKKLPEKVQAKLNGKMELSSLDSELVEAQLIMDKLFFYFDVEK